MSGKLATASAGRLQMRRAAHVTVLRLSQCYCAGAFPSSPQLQVSAWAALLLLGGHPVARTAVAAQRALIANSGLSKIGVSFRTCKPRSGALSVTAAASSSEDVTILPVYQGGSACSEDRA